MVNNVGNSLNNIGNSISGDMNNTSNNSANSGFMGTTDDNTDGYTATRTSTAEDSTVFGIDTTTWIWIVMALAAIGIGILIYSYFAQTNSARHNNLDD